MALKVLNRGAELIDRVSEGSKADIAVGAKQSANSVLGVGMVNDQKEVL